MLPHPPPPPPPSPVGISRRSFGNEPCLKKVHLPMACKLQGTLWEHVDWSKLRYDKQAIEANFQMLNSSSKIFRVCAKDTNDGQVLLSKDLAREAGIVMHGLGPARVAAISQVVTALPAAAFPGACAAELLLEDHHVDGLYRLLKYEDEMLKLKHLRDADQVLMVVFLRTLVCVDGLRERIKCEQLWRQLNLTSTGFWQGVAAFKACLSCARHLMPWVFSALQQLAVLVAVLDGGRAGAVPLTSLDRVMAFKGTSPSSRTLLHLLAAHLSAAGIAQPVHSANAMRTALCGKVRLALLKECVREREALVQQLVGSYRRAQWAMGELPLGQSLRSGQPPAWLLQLHDQLAVELDTLNVLQKDSWDLIFSLQGEEGKVVAATPEVWMEQLCVFAEQLLQAHGDNSDSAFSCQPNDVLSRHQHPCMMSGVGSEQVAACGLHWQLPDVIMVESSLGIGVGKNDGQETRDVVAPPTPQPSPARKVRGAFYGDSSDDECAAWKLPLAGTALNVSVALDVEDDDEFFDAESVVWDGDFSGDFCKEVKDVVLEDPCKDVGVQGQATFAEHKAGGAVAVNGRGQVGELLEGLGGVMEGV